MKTLWLICRLQICHVACCPANLGGIWKQESGGNWEVRLAEKWELTVLGKGKWKKEVEGDHTGEGVLEI